MNRLSRIVELNRKRDELIEQTRAVSIELKALELEESRSVHDCECVRLNRDLGIWNLALQESLGRVPLGLGVVSETLSALRGCPSCYGTGIQP
jgi:hypothetical protein